MRTIARAERPGGEAGAAMVWPGGQGGGARAAGAGPTFSLFLRRQAAEALGLLLLLRGEALQAPQDAFLAGSGGRALAVPHPGPDAAGLAGRLHFFNVEQVVLAHVRADVPALED